VQHDPILLAACLHPQVLLSAHTEIVPRKR
jgi:hypothetical protein